jgi:hypothetical protein
MRNIIYMIIIAASIVYTACEKDYVQPVEAFIDTEQSFSVNDVDGTYYESHELWFSGHHYDTMYPMGASFAMYYNDSVTASNVEVVGWTGDWFAIYSDYMVMSADSFYVTTKTPYMLSVQYEVLTGSVSVDTSYSTWSFESDSGYSEVLISKFRLYNSD